MFGKFGAIAIIALSGAIVAGLILRPTPDLPPALSIGVSEKAAPANTLEVTDDNKDKKPDEITPVTNAVNSAAKTDTDSSSTKDDAAETSEANKPADVKTDENPQSQEQDTKEAMQGSEEKAE